MHHDVLEGISFAPFVETPVPHGELIVSRTDLRGIITYANETFAAISGYSAQELIGKPHNIVRHPDMPSSVFAELWQTLREQGAWSGTVKNLRKDGGYYWVHAEISGVYKDGTLIEYKSLRTPISQTEAQAAQQHYDALRAVEEDRVRLCVYLGKQSFETLAQRARIEKCSIGSLIKRLMAD
ncbi:MAG: PAS domain-containing protein [Campylobacterales bacterium]|nr:PAS domain-containing protein [Campylobacterales bacterium]